MKRYKYSCGSYEGDQIEPILAALCTDLPVLQAVFQERDLLRYENARLQEQLTEARLREQLT